MVHQCGLMEVLNCFPNPESVCMSLFHAPLGKGEAQPGYNPGALLSLLHLMFVRSPTFP